MVSRTYLSLSYLTKGSLAPPSTFSTTPAFCRILELNLYGYLLCAETDLVYAYTASPELSDSENRELRTRFLGGCREASSIDPSRGLEPSCTFTLSDLPVYISELNLEAGLASQTRLYSIRITAESPVPLPVWDHPILARLRAHSHFVLECRRPINLLNGRYRAVLTAPTGRIQDTEVLPETHLLFHPCNEADPAYFPLHQTPGGTRQNEFEYSLVDPEDVARRQVLGNPPVSFYWKIQDGSFQPDPNSGTWGVLIRGGAEGLTRTELGWLLQKSQTVGARTKLNWLAPADQTLSSLEKLIHARVLVVGRDRFSQLASLYSFGTFLHPEDAANGLPGTVGLPGSSLEEKKAVRPRGSLSCLFGGHARLGNLIFMYAYLLTQAYEKDLDLFLPKGGYLYWGDAHPTFYDTFELDPKVQVIPGRGYSGNIPDPQIWPVERQCTLNFHTNLYEPQYECVPLDKNTYVKGYFQSSKFFKPELIRTRLKFRPEVSEPSRRYLTLFRETLFRKYGRAVPILAFHVRMGDNKYKADGYPLGCTWGLTPAFTANALEYLSKKIGNFHTLVFTDDREWSEKVFLNYPALRGHATLVGNLPSLGAPSNGGEPTPAGEGKSDPSAGSATDQVVGSPVGGFVSGVPTDLCAMSLCDHFIFTASSYSWWGAWLSEAPGKVVIHPDRWFTQGHGPDGDVSEPEWIQLPLMEERTDVFTQTGQSWLEAGRSYQ